MSKKLVALDLASFLDSDHAKSVEGLKPDQLKKIVGAFISICYEDLGKKPHLLDGQDVHYALGHQMPGRLARKDPLAPMVPDALRAFFKHVAETEVVTNSFEVEHGLTGTTAEFLETVRTGHNAHHHEKQEPVVHKAEKLGRNDPCSCGSGKKYKKCHGKAS
ncbi:MAG: hypothetical protein ACI8X5_003991 [Planctomycetota bacterium]|jgi:hypothetical protein